MKTSCGVAHVACAAVILAAAPSLHASEAPFQTGRFVNEGREVFSGTFSNDVLIDALTVGAATYRASMDELIEPLAVRISVDSDGDGVFGLLTDEMLRSGAFPAGLAVALQLDPAKFSTALEAMQGLSLAHMIYTDGTSPVQIDVLLVTSIYDGKPTEDDTEPELIVLGSMSGHAITAAAIIGGNVDDPIFAQEPVDMPADLFKASATGMEMVIRQIAQPQTMTIAGLDLSHDLGVQEGVQTIGYRVTIGKGAPAMIAVLGAGMEAQRVLAQDMPLVPEVDEFLLGALFAAGSGAGGSVFRVPGVQEGTIFNPRVPLEFRGDGGGGGGRPPEGFPPPTDPEQPTIPAPSAFAALGLAFALNKKRRRA